MNVVGSSTSISNGMLGEDWVDEESTRTELEDQGVLGTNVVGVFGIALNGEVHD